MECDGCTLCCELLEIKEVNSPAGELCKHCNNGCDIHDTIIPKECSGFYCVYLQMENASINLRPDKCGVIFEKITTDVFIGTVDSKKIILSDDAYEQINSFLDEGFSVVLYHQRIKKPIIFNTPNRTKESVWFEVQIVEDDRKAGENVNVRM